MDERTSEVGAGSHEKDLWIKRPPSRFAIEARAGTEKSGFFEFLDKRKGEVEAHSRKKNRRRNESSGKERKKRRENPHCNAHEYKGGIGEHSILQKYSQIDKENIVLINSSFMKGGSETGANGKN